MPYDSKASPPFLRPKIVFIPHRLDDNLQWQCSTCHTLVPTCETHFHLISCCEKFAVAQHSDDQNLDFLNDKVFERKLPLPIEMDDKVSTNAPNQRPKTKRLERPTPNINHPVIGQDEATPNINHPIIGQDEAVVKYKNLEKVVFASQSIPKSVAKTSNQNNTVNSVVKSQSVASRKHTKQVSNPNVSDKNYIDDVLSSSNKTQTVTPQPLNSSSDHKINTKNKLISDEIKSYVKTPIVKCEKSQNNEPKVEKGSVTLRKLSYSNNYTITQGLNKGSKKTIMKCYICSKEFDTKALPSHEAKCFEAKKMSDFENHEERLLQPQKHDYDVLIRSGCDTSGWEHFKSQLVPCQRCGRTFFPHRLPIHEKSCKGTGTVGKQSAETHQCASTVRNIKMRVPQKSIFLDCKNCGRKYSTSSITLHELKCKSGAEIIGNHRGKTGEISIEWENFNSQLTPCGKCGRKFLPERVRKHEPNCRANPVLDLSSKTKSIKE